MSTYETIAPTEYMFFTIDSLMRESSVVKRARHHNIDAATVQSQVSGEIGLNQLLSCLVSWRSSFLDPHAQVATVLDATNITPMRLNPLLQPTRRRLHYVLFVGLYLYHRRDEFLRGATFAENSSEFGHFINRVEIATSMLHKKYELAMTGQECMTRERQLSLCLALAELHQHLACCISAGFSLGYGNEQQLLHQGFCILAAAHGGPYIPHNQQIVLESVDYHNYGGANACWDGYAHTWLDWFVREPDVVAPTINVCDCEECVG